MKFSETWLREWVNPSLDSAELCEQLSLAGLEVDGIEPVAGAFTGVVVGHVVECGPHPDADKLQCTKVDVGADELLDIVCGAKNCRQGLKVAVATVGALLPGNFKIKKSKLRGQPSHGMLCSSSELGLSEESDGIMELPEEAPVGHDFRSFLGLDDNTIDIDLTANRADCLSLAGLAREVGALNRITINKPVWHKAEVTSTAQRSVHIAAAEACPRYVGRVLKGVNINTPSPLWLVEKLRRSGLRSVDVVVDVTNYVMLELGQPMHAYDLAKISGDIQVRFANPEEQMTLLDGQQVNLTEDDLLIADEKHALGLAGIFGGKDSGVNKQTQDLFLEAAYFSPLAISGRARRFGLHTDASHRFERGVDPQLQVDAMERATGLLLDLVGGEAGPLTVVEHGEQLPVHHEIHLAKPAIRQILGIEIADHDVEDILHRLGMAVKPGNDGWLVTSPSYRFDIEIREDLVEELARVHGYDQIPAIAPTTQLRMTERTEGLLDEVRIKQLFVDRGYQEAITYSFVDPDVQQRLFPEQKAKILPEPISQDMSAMRVSLLPGLLQALKYNLNRQQTRMRLFETGLRFTLNEQGELTQTPMLAGLIAGPRFGDHWQLGNEVVDFYDIKGDLEALLSLTGQLGSYAFQAAEHSAMHPGQCAAISFNDEVVGHVGALHPEMAKNLGIKAKVFVFELPLAAVSQRQIPVGRTVSRFPANRRDLAFVVEQSVAAADVLKLIEKIGGNQLVGLNLFDFYTGPGIADDKKSLAIALTMQDSERTLEEAEINAIVERVVTAVTEQFNASLRE